MTPSGNGPAHAFTAGQRVAYTFRALLPQITPELETFSFSDGSKAVLRWNGPNLAGNEGLIRRIVSRCYLTIVDTVAIRWSLDHLSWLKSSPANGQTVKPREAFRCAAADAARRLPRLTKFFGGSSLQAA